MSKVPMPVLKKVTRGSARIQMCAALARPTPAAAAAIFISAMARPAREPGHHAVGTHQSGGGLPPLRGRMRLPSGGRWGWSPPPSLRPAARG